MTRLILTAIALLAFGASIAEAAPRSSSSVSAPALLKAINATRHAHGLPAVREHRALSSAARAHSRDMVARGYFLHESGPGGERFDARVFRYWRPRGAAQVGEVLAWGSGPYATAKATVRMWLNSPPHRRIMLTRSFTHVGLGLKIGRFQGVSRAAVWTADFGRG